MKKFIILTLLLLGTIQAATISTTKPLYNTNEAVKVTVGEMPNDAGNWIGIYPKGASNAWENVVAWKWDGNVKNGTHSIDIIPEGEYEARVFFNNSTTKVEATSTFRVEALQSNAKITTTQEIFNTGENVKVTVSGMPDDAGNWIGIFPKGASSAWENILAWKWDGNVKNGTYTLDALPAGEYEARVFFNDSTKVEAFDTFNVMGVVLNTTVRTSKNSYDTSEEIVITTTQMLGNSGDWIGIYPKDASNAWENIVAWKWDGQVNNGTYTFEALPAGEYEVRVFFNNSFKDEASYPFSVTVAYLPPTVYENASDGTTNGWTTLEGYKKVVNAYLNGNRVIYVPHDWKDENGNPVQAGWQNSGHIFTNHTLFELTKDNQEWWNNRSQRFLQVDIHPYNRWGGAACFDFGVRVQTLQGQRAIYFSVWFGREGRNATKSVYGDWVELAYPITKDLVFSNRWQHVKLNLQEKLEELEPNNRILSVDTFLTTGGNHVIDNIKLTSD